MPGMNWQIVAALIGGGAMGAIIKIVYDVTTGRLPRVGRRIDINPIFAQNDEGEELSAKIMLSYNGESSEYQNLYIAEMAIENRGRSDFPEYQFAVELLEGDQCVFLSAEDPDASHKLELTEPISPVHPSSLLKMVLKPFNRGDRYKAKLYLVIPETSKKPNPPRFSSIHAVKFVDMPTVSEILAETAASASLLKIGPFGVTIRR